jgi:Ca2+-binding EF-hand superfamily protein
MRKVILTISFAILTSKFISAQENNDEKERRKGPPSIKQLFKDLDTNEDGKISLKEVKGRLKKDFKKVDLNEDGFITKEELKKAPKPKRPEKRENK